MEFKDLGLSAPLLEAINLLGFVEPTEIQQKAIPALKDSKTDFVGLAQTGTGKTAAFGLPLLDRIDPSLRSPQGLIVCPTRELCLQITSELEKYAKTMRNVRIVPVYGGADITKQMRDIKRGAQIVVATPGRMIDHLKRKTIALDAVSVVVLDEADEMLKMGFQEDINTILEYVPEQHSTWLFSATMLPEVARIAKNYMKDPVRVTVGSKNSSASNIEHTYCLLKERDKYLALRTLIDASPEIYAIVFCRTRRDAKEVARMLVRDGYNADALHGDLSQAQRDVVMSKYREKRLQILVATDVAARGIDVNDVTHVFHYHLPDDADNYTHRSGRTARAGKSGVSIILTNVKESRRISYIERVIGTKIECIKVPSAQEVRKKQLVHFVDRLKQAPEGTDSLKEVMPEVLDALADISKEDVVKRLLVIECEQLLGRYKKNVDLNLDASSSYGRSSQGGARLFVNIGSMDGLDNSSLVTFVAKETKLESSVIGDVSVKDKFSFFNVTDTQIAQQVVDLLRGAMLNNRQVRAEIAGGEQRSGSRRSGSPRGGGYRGGSRSSGRDNSYRGRGESRGRGKRF